MSIIPRRHVRETRYNSTHVQYMVAQFTSQTNILPATYCSTKQVTPTHASVIVNTSACVLAVTQAHYVQNTESYATHEVQQIPLIIYIYHVKVLLGDGTKHAIFSGRKLILKLLEKFIFTFQPLLLHWYNFVMFPL